MNYISGLMLGASLANMLRQTLSGTGDMSGMSGQGMRGGRGRAMAGGQSAAFPSTTGSLAGGASALTGLLGGGGRGGSASPLTALLGMGGRTGGASLLPTNLLGGGKSGGLAGLLPSAGANDGAAPAAQSRVKDVSAPPFVCVHASLGRCRYRTPYLTAEFAQVLEECLPRLPFVTRVRANAVAGSILLVYPPEDEAHILMLAEGLSEIFSEGRTAPPPATLAQSVRRSVHDFSGWIQRHTGGALDLSSVLAGVFVLRGIRQLVLSNNTPSGSQMLWWALTLMRGWKV